MQLTILFLFVVGEFHDGIPKQEGILAVALFHVVQVCAVFFLYILRH